MKVYLVIRSDLKMRRGKEIAQAGHAIQYMVEFISDLKHKLEGKSDYAHELVDKYFEWKNSGHAKIGVSVDSDDELDRLCARTLTIPTGYWKVVDEGRTEVDPDTLTCVAIGPVTEEEAQRLGLDKLKLR